MTNHEHLGNKLSEKLQFPQKDLNYLRENSSRFLGASNTKSNYVIQNQKLRMTLVMKVKVLQT